MKFFEALLLLCMMNGQSRQAYFVGLTNGLEQKWPNTFANRNVFQPNYNFGLVFEASKESLWGIGGDLKYSTETMQYSHTSTGQAYEYDLSYLRAPLRFHLYMNKLCRTIRPKLGFGPCVGYLVGTGRHTLDSEKYHAQDEIGRNFNKFDFGVQCMTGVNIRLSDRLLMNLDLTCYNGFVSIDESEAKTQSRAINLGLLVRIK